MQHVGTFAECVAVTRSLIASNRWAKNTPAPVVPELREYVEKMVDRRVRIVQQALTVSNLRGMLLRAGKNSGDEHLIILDTQANECWRRWIITKELMHLLYDTEDHFTGSISETAEDAMSISIPHSLSEPLSSERYAHFAAMEYLFQYGSRPKTQNDPSIRIARRFKVPERYVDLFYGTPYGKLSDEANSAL